MGRIASAWLFFGPRGTGKTSMARLLAMALNCEGGPKSDFDPNSTICTAIWKGEHLDVVELDGASHNSVDEIRDLQERCAYAPVEGHFRIIIVDEVHMLSNAAFNALLKILEEPPAHVKFIFATTEPAKIPVTVLSRCQRFQFRPISAAAMGEKLQKIAEMEGVIVDPAAIGAIVRVSAGAMRDAEILLDQLIVFAGKHLREVDVLNLHAMPSSLELKELADALIRRDGDRALELADGWGKRGLDLRQAAGDLGELLRHALLREKAERPAIMELLRAIKRCERELRFAPSMETTFAVGLLEAIENSRLRPIGEILRELNQ
jgi:DNA polymerase-3 subunit gamma/tau